MDGSLADLGLIEHFRKELTQIESRLASAPFPFNLRRSGDLVARARDRLLDVQQAIELLESLPVGALSYVQQRAGLPETEWPTPGQVRWYLSWKSLAERGARCRRVTRRGKPCRAKPLPGSQSCRYHLKPGEYDVSVRFIRGVIRETQDAVRALGSRPASQPLECTAETWTWAEEMVCEFALDPGDSALYEAYCELRKFAVEGTIPLWAFRTMVFRWATVEDFFYPAP
jgi:hypothetical protein